MENFYSCREVGGLVAGFLEENLAENGSLRPTQDKLRLSLGMTWKH